MARAGLILTPGFADWEYAFIAGTASPFDGIGVRFFAPATGQFRSQGIAQFRSMLSAKHG